MAKPSRRFNLGNKNSMGAALNVPQYKYPFASAHALPAPSLTALDCLFVSLDALPCPDLRVAAIAT